MNALEEGFLLRKTPLVRDSYLNSLRNQIAKYTDYYNLQGKPELMRTLLGPYRSALREKGPMGLATRIGMGTFGAPTLASFALSKAGLMPESEDYYYANKYGRRYLETAYPEDIEAGLFRTYYPWHFVPGLDKTMNTWGSTAYGLSTLGGWLDLRSWLAWLRDNSSRGQYYLDEYDTVKLTGNRKDDPAIYKAMWINEKFKKALRDRREIERKLQSGNPETVEVAKRRKPTVMERYNKAEALRKKYYNPPWGKPGTPTRSSSLIPPSVPLQHGNRNNRIRIFRGTTMNIPSGHGSY